MWGDATVCIEFGIFSFLGTFGGAMLLLALYALISVYALYCIYVVYVVISTRHMVDDSWTISPIQWVWDNAHVHHSFRRVLDVSIESLASSIPRGFLWGTATAAHQFEGDCTNNNWSHWELKTRYDPMVNDTVPTIRHAHKSDKACDHWNRVSDDIDLMKNFGCNAYRFSIEWSKIEPKRAQFNQDAI
jgi:hypothetical protein